MLGYEMNRPPFSPLTTTKAQSWQITVIVNTEDAGWIPIQAPIKEEEKKKQNRIDICFYESLFPPQN